MAYTSPATIDLTTGIGSLFIWITDVTGFWFGRMLMISIFIIFMFGYLKANRDDFVGAFAVSSYVTFVIGLIFWVIGLVNGLDFSVIIGAVILASLFLFLQKKDY